MQSRPSHDRPPRDAPRPRLRQSLGRPRPFDSTRDPDRRRGRVRVVRRGRTDASCAGLPAASPSGCERGAARRASPGHRCRCGRASRAVVASAIGDLGIVYHANLFNAQALQLYAIAASLDPADRRWPYYQGLLLEEHGDQEPRTCGVSTGRRRSRRVDGQAWLHVAEIRFKRGDADGAADAYRRVREAPAAPPATVGNVTRRVPVPLAAYGDLGLARLQIERGSRDEARTLLDRIVQTYPSFGSARALRRQLRDQPEKRPAETAARMYRPSIRSSMRWSPAHTTRSSC